MQVIDKSFGFDTAVEEAQRAINAAHVEAESMENGIGLVKLMGRYCGKKQFCHSLATLFSFTFCYLASYGFGYNLARSYSIYDQFNFYT